LISVLAKIGNINQILEIQMHHVSQTQRELVFKNTTPYLRKTLPENCRKKMSPAKIRNQKSVVFGNGFAKSILFEKHSFSHPALGLGLQHIYVVGVL
jgi:hypothetical protein